MRLEVETGNPDLLRVLFGGGEIEAGRDALVPGGGRLTFLGPQELRGSTTGLGQVLEFVLHVSGEVMVSLLASWLYDLLKNRASAVVIGRKRIKIADSTAKESLEAELKSIVEKPTA